MKKLLCTAIVILLAATPAVADDKAKLMYELSGYLEFVDYGGGRVHAAVFALASGYQIPMYDR